MVEDTQAIRAFDCAGVELYLIDHALRPALPSAQRAWLSAAELQHAAALRRASDAQRFATTRALLRALLAQHLGLAPGAVVLCSNRHGKPMLEGAAGPYFSIAHAGAYSLLALCPTQAIGVDIERIKPEMPTASLAAAVMSGAERAAAPLSDELFFRTWACKEALLKAWGCGLALAPASITLLVEPGGTLRPAHCPPGLADARIHLVDALAEHAAALAVLSAT